MDKDALYELLDSTANMLRGMTLDPAIPQHAKAPMHGKIAGIEAFLPDLLGELEKGIAPPPPPGPDCRILGF